ncbi:DUF1700 domain-containing protein [Vagococcus silagei]|uniref:DUF1700 domain-containing protein n=1 Tax=Vagococcus silagei TaxID=2508885 RepID=A0A4S3AZM6_9ENTE|nr:DUF1700 domain-containing protein [Vagococcus silagei]THB60254.1 DUF1700 domain-containing protein [Vagococcus silagei]
MNQEHFLIELRLHLKQLSFDEQQEISDLYQSIFEEKKALGLSEYEISKELGHPREIAISILKSKNLFFEDAPPTNTGWQEFFEEAPTSPHPYNQTQQSPLPPASGFLRVTQIIGLFFLNIFFMLWMIIVLLLLLLCGWIMVAGFTLAPFLAGFGLITAFSTYALFQFTNSLILCGIGLIGLTILKPVTEISFKLLKGYFKWNVLVMKGGRR